MFELVALGEKTYYIPNATNIGFYLEDENNVWIIDTGIDADTGKKILRLTDEKGWKVKGIINTHSHADHMGGNNLIVSRTGCKVLAHKTEKGICEHTLLNTTAVYGGFPHNEIRTKFFYSKPTEGVLEVADNLPAGLEIFPLPGHTFDMIGIKTPDNVYFLADSLVSNVTVTKYHVFYLYDIKSHYETLEFLKNLNDEAKGAVFIPSHCERMEDILELTEMNKAKVDEIKDLVLNLCETPTTLEKIVKSVFDHYELKMNHSQHTLLTSTLRSFLSYLMQEGIVETYFEDNYLLYKKNV